MDISKRTASRSRIALAAIVVVGCLPAAVGIAWLVGEPQRVEAVIAEPAEVERPMAPPSHEHARNLGVPGMSERELRAFETATLGTDHAREHALMRREEPGPKPSPESTERAQRLAVAAAVEAGSPADVGRWDFGATVSLPIVGIHAAMLPTGKVMIFSYPQNPRPNSAQAWLWDPKTGAKVRKDPPNWLDPKDGVLKPANIWCSGHTFTADGELVVFGGNLEFSSPTSNWKGLNKVYTFNPFTETWREQPDMRHGRWYPTGIRLADGRIPIMSGLDESGIEPFRMNEEVELFTPPPEAGGLGSVSLIGTTSYSNPALPPTGEYYPHMFAMPSGRALIAGRAAEQIWFMNTPGADSFTWTDAPNMSQRRVWGNAVSLPGTTAGSTKIMALGGTSYSLTPATNSTEIFDEANTGAGWRPAPSTVVGRAHANTVLLPDGSMVQVGGGVGRDDAVGSPQHASTPDHLQIELWDPETGQWRLGPAQAENRAYHSTALLLPDGRVLSAGDEFHGGNAGDTGEIYEPPYLFRGPRPTIGSAPATIRVGAPFGVQTPDANVTRAVLVAPGSVTHAVDMNQRLIPLALDRRSGCVNLTAPPTAQAAPPGYYMLFLLNDQGVPSEAKFVRLHDAAVAPAQCDAAPPPPDTTAPTVRVDELGAVSGSVDVTATASDNTGVVGVQFRLDGVNLGAEDRSSPYSTTWRTTGVPNGTYQLAAVARDAAGNRATSSPITVVVSNADTTAPTVSMTTPANGSTVSEQVRVSAQASDDVGVASVQFMLDGQTLGLLDTSAPYAIQWATRNTPNGTHRLTAVATDTNDNTSTSAPMTVTVQNLMLIDPPLGEPLPIPASPAAPAPPNAAPVAPANRAPVIGRLRVSGGKISFRLSERATVTLSFERAIRGRPARSTRYVKLSKKLTHRGRAGANTIRFPARRHGLRAGSYRLTARATDALGMRSIPARARFRVVVAPAK